MSNTNPELEVMLSRVLAELSGRIGRQKAIGMGELYSRVFGRSWSNRINDTRPVRDLVEILRFRGHRICSDQTGYWLASTDSELLDYCAADTKKALKILKKVGNMRRVSLPDLLGQLRLDDYVRQLEQRDAAPAVKK
jgi:hypothetical protein